MFALSPWSIARRAGIARRAIVWLVLAAILYGFGMHAARACVHDSVAVAAAGALAGDPPCHHGDVDVAEAACEAHCRTDTQSGRLSLSFDLPPAAPVDLAAALATPTPVGLLPADFAPSRRDTGPPLHIVLHRLLR